VYRVPTPAEIVELAARDHVSMTLDEAEALLPGIAATLAAFGEIGAIESLEQPSPSSGDRSAARRPSADEDPYNAFITMCDVPGARDGPLAGRRIGIKDNIDVAGIPTTNGSLTTAHTPAADAVVVERILRAGGRIVGKLNMDDFGAGATGEVSAFGAPRNPFDPTRTAGGSSGGSGAAVRSGAVDLALGVDQGGSARIPASFCGIVALMATHGLVPSWGVTHLDHTLDAVCPMGRSVPDVALLLQVVAGEDPRDPQWVRGAIRPGDYLDGIEDGVRDWTVGVIRESVPVGLCDEAVVGNLNAAASALGDAGAEVREVSIPLWERGTEIALALLCHLWGACVRSEGEGFGHLGLVDLERMRTFARARRESGHLLPPGIKIRLITSRFLDEEYENLTYGIAQNRRLQLKQQIETALGPHDILLTPTTPTTAFPLSQTGSTAVLSMVGDRLRTATIHNTAPVNLAGHPALALPSGSDGSGLPTSVQLIGRRFREADVLRAGRLLERRLGSA
jgi:amidase